MDMLLMGLCVCVFAMGVVAIAFQAATRSETSISSVQPNLPLLETDAPAHIVERPVAVSPALPHQQVPIELLLAQIENHVRLEHAAAESFIGYPTQALLHSKTRSPFVN